MKEVYILIGLPGSGKSTTSKQILQDAVDKGLTTVIHSTDNYFIKDGIYSWNPVKLGYYHKLNQAAANQSMVDGVNRVIIDNTNLTAKDRKVYENLAADNNYEVKYVVVGEFTEEVCPKYAQRNTHGVPLASLLNMIKKAKVPDVLQSTTFVRENEPWSPSLESEVSSVSQSDSL